MIKAHSFNPHGLKANKHTQVHKNVLNISVNV